MLKFRSTNIIFILLLIILIGYDLYQNVALVTYVGLILVYFIIVFYGSYYVNSNFFLDVICNADTNERVIALSFDDGPANEYTPAILEILKENGVQAAFFCIGNHIPLNRHLLKKIHTDNHIIGNHTHSHHIFFDLFSARKMKQDIELMSHTLESELGLRPKLFRPPYGVTNPNLRKAIINGNYTPIGWSVRSMDTVIKDKRKLLNNVNKSLKPGAIFLFHDTCKVTLDILPAFLMHVKQSGYKIVRLDDMLNIKAYA